MLTVLFATRNRARILRDGLEAYCRLQAPPAGWKLVVVDNGSTDDTPSVLDAFANRLPLHFVSEPKIGKNAALNSGLAIVEGDLTALTDDDVFPYADWLVQLRKAADSNPLFSIFGGVIVPRWEAPPPQWFEWLNPGPIFTITPPWLKEGELAPYEVTQIMGPNMLVRTSVFQSGARFDPSIGPCGCCYPMGSETELILRLSSQGHKAWHVSGAIVEHLIRKEQFEKAWVMGRAINYGRGQFRLRPDANLWGDVPRHLYRDVPREAFLVAAKWVAFRDRALLKSRWQFNYLVGRAIESRAIARERRSHVQSVAKIAPGSL